MKNSNAFLQIIVRKGQCTKTHSTSRGKCSNANEQFHLNCLSESNHTDCPHRLIKTRGSLLLFVLTWETHPLSSRVACRKAFLRGIFLVQSTDKIELQGKIRLQ